MQGATYQSSPVAVLPAVIARGTVLGVLYTAFVIAAVFGTITEGGEGSRQFLAQSGLLTGTGFLALLGAAFLLPLCTAVALAVVDYRRRRYVLDEDRLVEKRGVFSTRESAIAYDDIEDVTFVRPWHQRLYGVATLRINDIEMDEAGSDEELRVRYVETPETFYSELRSAVVEDSITDIDLPPLQETTAAEDLSALSGEQLAAETSSSSLMPRAILHPQPRQAAIFGTIVGVFFSIFVVPWLSFGALVLFGSGVSFIPGGLAGVTLLSFAGFIGVVTARFYRSYDRAQYELYDDHVRKVTAGERTTVQFADVADVTRPGTGSGNVRLWEWRNIGHVGLLAEDGETLLVLEYVHGPDELQAQIETLVDAAQ